MSINITKKKIDKFKMKITIIGTGYVGLVSGVCLASKGHDVTCVDIREEVVINLNKGIPHIHENNLEELLKVVINNGNFIATTNLIMALESAEIVLVAVGTPSDEGEIDLTQIESAAIEIGRFIKKAKKYVSIVLKSTVVPTTTDTFVKNIIQKESGKSLGEFGLGMNPEFLKEGDAIADFNDPDRIVIGYEDNNTKELLKKMYEPWDCDKLFVNTRTAELIKYSNNTMLACLISMNNELANLAAIIGNIDYLDVIKGVSLDKRWSPIVDGKRVTPSILDYFIPGAGFGGSCFPKDVQAIRTQGESKGIKMLMTNSILSTNENQPFRVIEMLEKLVPEKKLVLLLGLAFKPNTDDIRESSSIKILKQLLTKNYKVVAHDPIAIKNTSKEIIHPNLKLEFDWRKVIHQFEVIIIGTNWDEYLEVKTFINHNPKEILIFDTKRLFSNNEITKQQYLTFGKS
jgi:UDPglucose 6-dehydrogenase/GDP-mannose 6-dehydrogenase